MPQQFRSTATGISNHSDRYLKPQRQGIRSFRNAPRKCCKYNTMRTRIVRHQFAELVAVDQEGGGTGTKRCCHHRSEVVAPIDPVGDRIEMLRGTGSRDCFHHLQ